MKSISTRLMASAMLAASSGAGADAVTYYFTGTVYSSDGSYSSAAIGSSITGTYTIDLANGIPSQSSLPISIHSPWQINARTGSLWGLTPGNAYVFSSTAQDGSFAYATNPTASAYSNWSTVQDTNSSTGDVYNGYESNVSSAGGSTDSGFFLYNTSNTNDGLPQISYPLNGNGHFGGSDASGAGNDVWYNIDSISLTAPVPVPTSGLLLLSAMAGLGVMARRVTTYHF